jgi:hypothetical protein
MMLVVILGKKQLKFSTTLIAGTQTNQKRLWYLICPKIMTTFLQDYKHMKIRHLNLFLHSLDPDTEVEIVDWTTGRVAPLTIDDIDYCNLQGNPFLKESTYKTEKSLLFYKKSL